MQPNSNQQTFSVSIRTKREKFRAQIRRQQLQTYFRAKRIEHFSNQNPNLNDQFYKNLETRIKLSQNDPESLQTIETQIRKLFDKNPEEQVNFYILAQYLLKKPSKCIDFKDFIIHQNNLIFHSSGLFSWCFGIYFACLHASIDQNKLQNHYISDIQKLDMFLAALIDSFYNNSNFIVDSETLHCFEIYTVIFTEILELTKDQDYFPIFVFNSIVDRLTVFYMKFTSQTTFYAREIKIKVTQLVNQITRNIENGKIWISEKSEVENRPPAHINPDYFLKTVSIQKFMESAGQIFYDNIRDASDEKIECFKSILILSKWSGMNAGEFLFSDKIIKELIFNMINQKVQVSIFIMKSFISVLPGLTKSKWRQMLNHSLHINLVNFLRDTLSQVNSSLEQEFRYSESLHQLLLLIDLILIKAQDIDIVIYRKMFSQMEIQGFGNFIQSMNHRRYDEKIEKVWGEILDMHFSTGMEEEYEQNNENSGDFMNVEINQGTMEKSHHQQRVIRHQKKEQEFEI